LKEKIKIIESSDQGRLLSCGETTPLPGDKFDGSLKVDYLPGGITAWRKTVFQEFRYSTFFAGYGFGEDKYFSTCVGKKYDLYVCGTAVAKHLHEEGNRPGHFNSGFYTVYNHYFIVSECVNGRHKKIKFFAFHLIDILNGLLSWPFRKDKKKTFFTGLGKLLGLVSCVFKSPVMSSNDPALMNRETLREF
jgi:hypothetical protein